MEKKKFFDVFQNLKLNSDLEDIFSMVTVTRITSNMDHTKIRVYIESSRLIEKSAIFAIRDAIAQSLRIVPLVMITKGIWEKIRLYLKNY